MSTLEGRAHDAHQDRIADDQAERELLALRADRSGFDQGDHVTVGKRREVFTITGFGVRANGAHYAILWRPGSSIEEFANCDRLKAVQ